MFARAVVLITDDTTRADIAEALEHANKRAKAMSRRGRTGTRHPDYDVIHDMLNNLLCDYEEAPA